MEDDARARDFFEASVRASPALRWLAGLGSVAEVRAWLDATQDLPHVLLADLGLPDGSGVDVIRAVTARFPACEALVVSVFGDEESVLASIEAGYAHIIERLDDLVRRMPERERIEAIGHEVERLARASLAPAPRSAARIGPEGE